MVWIFVKSKYPRCLGAEAEFLRKSYDKISEKGETSVKKFLLIGAGGRVAPVPQFWPETRMYQR